MGIKAVNSCYHPHVEQVPSSSEGVLKSELGLFLPLWDVAGRSVAERPVPPGGLV